MASFACIASDQWQQSKELDIALKEITKDYVQDLRTQASQKRQQLQNDIERLENEINQATEALEENT